MSDTETHYERLAHHYDMTWSHTPEYVRWMNDAIAGRLELGDQARIADIGAGTGLFLRALMEHVDAEHPILCIDPSEAMLDRLPDDPRLQPLPATAEDVASGKVALPYAALDAVVAKEAIHHLADIPAALRGFASRLAPGGQILVVTLPPKLDYPLFQAALDRFAERHPEPSEIARQMEAAGLHVDLTYDEFPISVERERYIDLVGNRWMSVLSTFDDAELEAGLSEMRARHPEKVLNFVDRFAFALGRKDK